MTLLNSALTVTSVTSFVFPAVPAIKVVAVDSPMLDTPVFNEVA